MKFHLDIKFKYFRIKIYLFTLIPIYFINCTNILCQTNQLSDTDKVFGLMQVWSTVKDDYVFYYRDSTLNWDDTIKANIQKVIESKTTEEYYNILRVLVSNLNDGHTIVLPPEILNGANDYAPIEFRKLENSFIIYNYGITEETIESCLCIGDKLIKIDNIAVEKYFSENCLKYFNGGTIQWGNSFGSLIMMMGIKDSKVKLTLQNNNQNEYSIDITRNSDLLNGKFTLPCISRSEVVTMENIEENIVYIKIPTFHSEKVLNNFVSIITQLDLEHTKGLIVDLRDNPGGSSNIAYKIGSYLTNTTLDCAKWTTRQSRSSYKAWGNEQEWYQSDMGKILPNPKFNYLGPLVFLINGNTYSSAEDLIVPFHNSKRAILIGEISAGSTGQPINVKLPGGGLLKVCTKHDFYPSGKEFVGCGIIPDIHIPVHISDIIEKKDPILEGAIKYLNLKN